MLLPIFLVLVIGAGLGLSAFLPQLRQTAMTTTPTPQPSPTPNLPSIRSFEECVAAGNLVQESMPERCTTAEGVTFERTLEGDREVTGQVVCLPKKNQKGPQTLECAIGLRDAQGNHYGITRPDQQPITNMTTQTQVTLKGRFIPIPSTSTTPYNIIGVLEIAE